MFDLYFTTHSKFLETMADQFLVTPATGLKVLCASVAPQAPPVRHDQTATLQIGPLVKSARGGGRPWLPPPDIATTLGAGVYVLAGESDRCRRRWQSEQSVRARRGRSAASSTRRNMSSKHVFIELATHACQRAELQHAAAATAAPVAILAGASLPTDTQSRVRSLAPFFARHGGHVDF